jgi:hypothetical protein
MILDFCVLPVFGDFLMFGFSVEWWGVGKYEFWT